MTVVLKLSATKEHFIICSVGCLVGLRGYASALATARDGAGNDGCGSDGRLEDGVS